MLAIDGIAELAALHLLRSFHQAGEVVGDGLVADGAVHALDDQVGRLGPAQVAEHHLARENDRAGVDLVEIGVLGGGAVGRLEDGVARIVVDVAARRDADAAHLGRQRVGEIIAVEVRRGDHVEFGGTRQHLLQRDVGDGVLDHDLARGQGRLLLGVGLVFTFLGLGLFPLVPGVGLARRIRARPGHNPSSGRPPR